MCPLCEATHFPYTILVVWIRLFPYRRVALTTEGQYLLEFPPVSEAAYI